MVHPLVSARPTDPFLLLRLDEGDVEDYVIDGDQIAYLRGGRTSGETWLTALGSDPQRITTLIDVLLERANGKIDGVHTEADVYLALPDRLRNDADAGHWAIWILPDDVRPPMPGDVALLSPEDDRICELLGHSPSAWLFPGGDEDVDWIGVEDGDRLVAVGAVLFSHGRAHLASVCTHPDRRGQGLARVVCSGLTAHAQSRGVEMVWLDMYADNQVAARLYDSLGFVLRGRYRSAYLPGRGRQPTG